MGVAGALASLLWGLGAAFLAATVVLGLLAAAVVAYLALQRRAEQAQVAAVGAYLFHSRLFNYKSQQEVEAEVRAAARGDVAGMSWIAHLLFVTISHSKGEYAAGVPEYLVRLVKGLNGLGLSAASFEKPRAATAASELGSALTALGVESAAGKAAVIRAGGVAALSSLLQQGFMDQKAVESGAVANVQSAVHCLRSPYQEAT